MKKKVDLIITDLDNTLFDWFKPWYRAYDQMISDISDKSKINRNILIAEIKKIHEKAHTAEYTYDFLFMELEPLLKTAHADMDFAAIKELYKDIRHRFYKTKKDYLKLYPGVMEVLTLAKKEGCQIVAYTESMAFYSKDRLIKLGLDGVIDILFSPKGHEIPKDFEFYRSTSDYDLKETKHIELDFKHKKPDASIIEIILTKTQVDRSKTIYIGDSLSKDIAMAQEAKVTDVYAKYGVSNHSQEYELLKQVTHWTQAEVDKEKSTHEHEVLPKYTLNASFVELLNYFSFKEEKNECLENIIKIWNTTIDVQKHFNDIELKIRQLAISLTGVLLGLIVPLYDKMRDMHISLIGHNISIFSFYFLVLFLIWTVFYFVDAKWYHPLLKGAVKQGIELEKLIQKEIPIKGLTITIGEASPLNIICGPKLHSTGKLNLFYGFFMISFLMATIVCLYI